jgi:hypothetical protein
MKKSASILLLGFLLAGSGCGTGQSSDEPVVVILGKDQFLPEDIALKAVQHTLNPKGAETTTWQPVRRGRTVAPNGRADDFMVRNTLNPDRGVIMLTNGTGSTHLAVVELRKQQVFVQAYDW